MDIRTGTGLDFHRLIDDEARPLLIGGVEIPGKRALLGHSDADVLLHALADAILGASGHSDIGIYFSDKDQANKNLDSSVILKKSLALMSERGYRLSNADITLIGEEPRIAPHREKILERLADLLAIAQDRIGLKATTTEKMGALGRSEGVGCLATVLIQKD
ncbi:MAG: 2-C-methyl-D-erythritol 2,4-cyclodiphosphate synthase [Leptospirales bacterium]|nr:2-C-methyl-D-erythritol 2,4-cyclodiphosphate synthase [Leptospirales bacterium]